jgi:protoheme IX farnesyltransferase
MGDTTGTLIAVFKLRIGVAIMLSALAGMAVTPGAGPGAWQTLLFALAVLLSSASAGAFNQFAERDLDARMPRTRQRPFVTGRYRADAWWLSLIVLMVLVSVAVTAFAANAAAAAFVFLGAFTYGIVYTVWLKRRTWLNIVIGGLSGSFAVLAGAAAVDPGLSVIPVLLAVVLFLWTPPHFWSLAFIYAGDYAGAGVPMLPVVAGARTAVRVIFIHTLALVLVSLLLFWYGLGWIYLAGAGIGGAYFIHTSYRLLRHPDIRHARDNFRASLIQLTLLIAACVADAWIS